jgi:hypothetical protein
MKCQNTNMHPLCVSETEKFQKLKWVLFYETPCKHQQKHEDIVNGLNGTIHFNDQMLRSKDIENNMQLFIFVLSPYPPLYKCILFGLSK